MSGLDIISLAVVLIVLLGIETTVSYAHIAALQKVLIVLLGIETACRDRHYFLPLCLNRTIRN